MKMRGVVAELGGEVVGLAHFHLQHVTFALEPRVYLEDLFVAPAARRRGVGRALIEAVYAAADEAGCPEVYWKAKISNARARSLYDRVAGCNGETVYQRTLRPKD
jgi:GNAT superfamily N-acetyltransferase